MDDATHARDGRAGVESGETLPGAQGSSGSPWGRARGMLRRRLAIAVAATAVGVGVMGTAVAFLAAPDPGVVLTDDGSAVATVLPGSPAWRDGLRAGYAVAKLTSSDEAGGWALDASDGVASWSTTLGGETTDLRATGGTAIAGALLALLAVLLAMRASPYALVAAAAGSILAIGPFLATGDLATSTSGAVAGLLVAGSSVALVLGLRSRRLAVAAAGGGLLLGLGWLAARFGAPGAFDLIDAARSAAMIAAPVVAIVAIEGAGGIAALPRRLARLTTGEVTAGAIGLAVLVALGTVARVDPRLLLVIAIAAVLAYPRTRSATLRVADRVLLADVRERASIRAIEDERGRVARGIHDVPLQEIAGVIRQLEADGDAGPEVSTLHDVATHLRDVVAVLHPPVLQDLGLGPALRQLAGQLDQQPGGPALVVDLDDLASHRPDRRPPAEVELAAYRIVQEALGNAIRHGRATTVALSGVVAAHHVNLGIRDDGIGFGDDAVRSALRAGHVGISGMRQRAASIGADLTIDGSAGTAVRLEWSRP